MSTRSLVNSHLGPDTEAMKDAVIEALNIKHTRFGGAKGDRSEEAALEKWVDTVRKTSPLKTLPPPSPKAGEASRAANDASPDTSPPSTGSKPRCPEDRPEHLAPHISEFSRLMNIWRTLATIPLASWLGLCNSVLST